MAKLSLHKASHDPRAAALVALHQVLHQTKDSQAALDDALSSTSMVPTDKRLCTELVYGTLRNFIRLTWIANKHLDNPEKLPVEMYLSLIQALHELVYLRIPARATVDWTVRHVRNRFSPGLGKVANAVLRTVQRNLKQYKDQSYYKQETLSEREAFAIWYSVPQWLIELWFNAYGEDTATLFLESLQKSPLSGIRLNIQTSGWQEVKNKQIEAHTENETHLKRPSAPPIVVGKACLAFGGSVPWELRELLKSGQASRQSPAAYEALQVLEPETWPTPVWDACSGRGNKTLALLEQGVEVSLASDPSLKRLSHLAPAVEERHLAPEGLKILPSSAQAAADQLALEGKKFGTILIDAPCSGLGTINRRPEIKVRRTVKDIESLVQTQAAILDAAKKCLIPGGRLAYITCTLNPAENEHQVAAFIERTPGARLLFARQTPADSPLREFFYSALIQIDQS